MQHHVVIARTTATASIAITITIIITLSPLCSFDVFHRASFDTSILLRPRGQGRHFTLNLNSKPLVSNSLRRYIWLHASLPASSAEWLHMLSPLQSASCVCGACWSSCTRRQPPPLLREVSELERRLPAEPTVGSSACTRTRMLLLLLRMFSIRSCLLLGRISSPPSTCKQPRSPNSERHISSNVFHFAPPPSSISHPPHFPPATEQ